jgi:hypothetical protein
MSRGGVISGTVHDVDKDDDDDDDTCSVITNITTATITPSESASVIFHNNSFSHLKSASTSSGESTPPETSIGRKIAAFENELVEGGSTLSTSTAKATIDPQPTPSIVTIESLISQRSGATKDWSTISDNDASDDGLDGRKTPTGTVASGLNSLSLSDDDDGEGTWITPTNIKKHKIRDMTSTNPFLSSSPLSHQPQRRLSSSSSGTPGAVMKSACMTGDFAMQNVALQMGLNLINMDGGGIRSVKTWVLRCHGCFTYPPLLLKVGLC